MFPNPFPCFLWCYLLVASLGFEAQACAIGEHHSTTYHYNNAQKVFVGVLVKQQCHPQSDTTWLIFRVKKAYKDCSVGQVVRLQANAYISASLPRKSTHLIYAQATSSAALYCPKTEAFRTANTRRQVAVLERILTQADGIALVEYSPYGKVWATGCYKNGQPENTWNYYAYSGELQWQAQYAQGLRANQWRQFSHTSDARYKIFHEIITGVYAREWNDYTVLDMDTSSSAPFRYILRYLVQGDTVTERFYYNNPHLTQDVHYKDGQRDGLENFFDEQQQSYRTYTFRAGQLQGPYREILPWAQHAEGSYLEVKGVYEKDQRQAETHYYYNAAGRLLCQNVVIQNGVVLPVAPAPKNF